MWWELLIGQFCLCSGGRRTCCLSFVHIENKSCSLLWVTTFDCPVQSSMTVNSGTQSESNFIFSSLLKLIPIVGKIVNQILFYLMLISGVNIYWQKKSAELNHHPVETFSSRSDGKPSIPFCQSGLMSLGNFAFEKLWIILISFFYFYSVQPFHNINNKLTHAWLSWDLKEIGT